MERLIAGAARLGISLDPRKVEQFRIYLAALLDWNRRVNLTAITAPGEVETKHFLDSLTVARSFGDAGPPARLVDVGSGAGFPGIPLKIAFPDVLVTLLESTQKKAAFLDYVCNLLGLEGVQRVAERAEEAARQPQHRESYPLVVARAVAPLPALAELTLPFCAIGGMVAVQKKGDVGGEVARAAVAIQRLGGRLRQRINVGLPELDDGRVLVVIDKIGPTPAQYPRRAGMPARRPLQ